MEPAALREAVAHHYDELDPFYRSLWGEHLHHGLWERGDESAEEAVVALALRVAREARIRPADAVLDIGCGYGATARLLAERFGAAVTGITLSPVQHAHALASAPPGPHVRFLLGDWLTNELLAASFDAAIAIESTEHMGDKVAAFAEAARVLRPGGRLVVCAWIRGARAGARLRRRLLEPIVQEGRLASLDTARSYVAWLKAAGFRDVAARDLTGEVARTWTVCLRRMAAELRRPAAWRYLMGRGNRERRFALTVARIALAYRVGALRYVMIRASSPLSAPRDG